ncbi:MAG TPA: excalibur calcium-binding domain-containing protein [Microbacterium sp.]|uniref:excalibur calcium-binding domain-containing protein n=1 Tax=Microbacterium sp. TaxID=51671 RepID=UPI002B4952AD|nr:excalibur calcium-binding domain-containing protein [Microbacterium sp.]HKT57236.1 excalibur calcium-binding domain-containing protein [Microbacterium sp.]
MRGKGTWIWGGIVVVVCVVIGLAAENAPHGQAPQRTDAAASSPATDAGASASTAPDPTTPAPRPPATHAPEPRPAAGTALALLKTLPVKGRAPKTGYARIQFGPAWADVDHNGCDTRNDILRRDLRHLTLRGSCVVLSGILNDPYTAVQIHFVRGVRTSTAVQIDHVVALSDAWQTGAQRLTAAQRELLGNDPLNLLAVDGPTNEAKGDGDAATWLPPNKAFRCRYVATQISVKAAYRLWVTAAEKAAMGRVLAACPAQPAYRDALVGTAGAIAPPVTVTPKATTPTQTTAPGSVSYANCAAVRAAGKAPLYRGQPGYSRRLDRDGDGIACE